MWNHSRIHSENTATACSSLDEDDNVFADDPVGGEAEAGNAHDKPTRHGEDTLRRFAAGRQYGYTGPLADIVGAANRLKSVPADHDLRVLKTHQRQLDQEGDDGHDLRIQNRPRPALFDDIIHKTILVGDSGVGKTSLLVQFDTGKFNLGAFSATVGIGFTNKIVNVDGAKVKLQIWDTAGQERFRSVTHAYYRDAHALLLLYDVTNRKSYNNTRAWLAEIREYAQGDVVILLLGNKCDCKLDREVSKEDGEKLAREYNVPFMETSAKSGLNVEFAFNAVARELIYRRSSYPEDPRFNVKEYIETKSEKADPGGGGCLCA